MSNDPFLRKKPCDDCPFRAEPSRRHGRLFPGLHPDRIIEIGDSLRDGAMFPCHKSVDYGDTGQMPTGEHWCAGALGTILRTGDAWNNPGTRFAASAGMFNPDDYDHTDAPIYDNLEDWGADMEARWGG